MTQTSLGTAGYSCWNHDPTTMNVLKYCIEGGSGIPLTPKAEKVLRFLVSNPGRMHDAHDIGKAAGCQPGGRSVETHISTARQCLGPDLRERLVLAHGSRAYGWMGAPVAFVPVAVDTGRVKTSVEIEKLAVKTRLEVAQILGISVSSVAQIERKALAKLRDDRRIKRDWLAMITDRSPVQYDPFHEIWLFQVADRIRDREVKIDLGRRLATCE